MNASRTPAGTVEDFPLPAPYRPAADDVVTLLNPDLTGPNARFPGRWRVAKVNPSTVQLAALDGQPTGTLKASHALCVKATAEQAAAPAQPAARAAWWPATIVRWAAAPEKAHATLFVVMIDKGGRTVNRIMALGGDPVRPGRYWREVPAAQLAEVPGEQARAAVLSATTA